MAHADDGVHAAEVTDHIVGGAARGTSTVALLPSWVPSSAWRRAGCASRIRLPVAAAAPGEPVPERAATQYATALQLLKGGKTTDAELELKQLAVAYPQYTGPQLNLGLLYLKADRLPEAEKTFSEVLARVPGSAVAGNELGIVERRLGKFTEAEAAYQRALAADPNYAAAHLNLGVLYDLYLGQPREALDHYERYIAIAGENKQVTSWVAELRKRVAAAPAAKKEAS